MFQEKRGINTDLNSKILFTFFMNYFPEIMNIPHFTKAQRKLKLVLCGVVYLLPMLRTEFQTRPCVIPMSTKLMS